MFGRIEKITKRKEEILTVGEVRILEHDWNSYDLKILSQSLGKLEGIRDAKRIYTTKSDNTKAFMCMDGYYRNDLNEPQSILKKGKTFQKMKLVEKPLGIPIKARKLKDQRPA